MFAVLVASAVALYLPATRLRCAPVRLLLEPRDDMKVGFSRGTDDGPRTSFAPTSVNRAAAPPKTVNEELMDEIQALMPPEKPAPKEATPVDLNGIKPRDLLLGQHVESASMSCWLVTRLAVTPSRMALRALGTATHARCGPLRRSGPSCRLRCAPGPLSRRLRPRAHGRTAACNWALARQLLGSREASQSAASHRSLQLGPERRSGPHRACVAVPPSNPTPSNPTPRPSATAAESDALQARCDDVRRGVLRGGAVHAGLGQLLRQPSHRRHRPLLRAGAVTLPLRCRYVTVSLHCRYIAVT